MSTAAFESRRRDEVGHTLFGTDGCCSNDRWCSRDLSSPPCVLGGLLVALSRAIASWTTKVNQVKLNAFKYDVFAPMGRFQLEFLLLFDGKTVENKGKLIPTKLL